jgi:polyhydroxybutyrate depolymerase
VTGVAGTPAAGVGAAGMTAAATTGMAGAAAPSGASGTGPAAGSGGAGGAAATGTASAAAGSRGASGAAGVAGMLGTAGAPGAPMTMPAGPPADCPQMPLAAGDHEYTLKSANGIEYKYILSVPKSVDQNQKTPLLIHWHALSSDPEEARMVTSVDAKAEAAKTLVVFPRSPDKSWDVGSCCTATVGGQSRDESVFVRELVKDVQTKACVDAKRIYTNGFSNGGMISQMIACKLADLFAAAAPMGSTLTIPQAQCTPTRPIPIFLINGTADPLVGYGAPGFAGGIAATADVKFWADKNKCEGEPEMFVMKGAATCKKYTKCAEGAEVAFCSVEGMGHCVPGMKKESAANCLTKSGIPLGPANDDIDAIQMDMDFLLRFSLP